MRTGKAEVGERAREGLIALSVFAVYFPLARAAVLFDDSRFTPVAYDVLEGVAAGLTFLFAFLLFRTRLALAPAVGGGLLVTHYGLTFGWETQALLPALPFLVATLYVLAARRPYWYLLPCVAVTAFLGREALIVEVVMLLTWFVGEAIGQATRPKLIEPTLHIPPILRWLPWAAVFAVAGLGIWLSLTQSLGPPSGSWNLNRSIQAVELNTVNWTAAGRRAFSLGRSGWWAGILLTGAVALAGAFIRDYGRLFWVIICLSVSSLLLLAGGWFVPAFTDVKIMHYLIWALLAPLSITALSTVVAVWLEATAGRVLAVVLLLLWAVALTCATDVWLGWGSGGG